MMEPIGHAQLPNPSPRLSMSTSMPSSGTVSKPSVNAIMKSLMDFASEKGLHTISPELAEMKFKNVIKIYAKGAPVGILKTAGAANSRPPLGPSSLAAILARYAGKAPVLVVGDTGGGKTHSCRQFAEAGGYDIVRIVSGHRGVESFDLLGHHLIIGNQTEWVYGEVTELFRFVGCDDPADLPAAAAAGRRGFLMFDEFYRIPTREREFLLSMLSPHEINGVLCYQISTGRPIEIDDTGKHYRKEILYAPVASMTIVATSNLGVDYDVDEGCPASRERWVVHYLEASDEDFERLVAQKLEVRGFGEDLVICFMRLKSVLDKAKEDRHLRESISIRTALRILDATPDEASIGRTAYQVGQTWLATDANGKPLIEQAQVLRTALDVANLKVD